MADTSATMADVQSRIQKQRQLMKGYQALRSASTNPEVQRQAESNIRDSQRSISYLEESLQSLMNRRASSMASSGPQSSSASVSSGSIASPTTTFDSTSSAAPAPSSQAAFQSTTSAASFQQQRIRHHQHQQQQQYAPSAERPYPGDASSAYLSRQRNPNENSQGGAPAGSYASADGYGPGGNVPGRAPGGDGATGEWQPAPINRMGTSVKRTFTNLDLIKYDTPLTTAKISRMLHQLEFKLQIEKQYKQGIDKMAALYQAEGDRKSRNDAESKRVESQSKIMLLQQALKRYKQLHVMEDDDDNDGQSSSIEGRRQDLRKPLSGTLQISVKAARDIEHAPTQRLGRSVRESTVVIKVEDAARARTPPSRTDRWQDDFDFAVDNANEIEVTVYDKVGNGHPVPVGMLWIRISDIVEELRKKKFGQPGTTDGRSAAASGWVTAGDVQQQEASVGGSSAGYASAGSSDYSFNQPAGAPVPPGPPAEGLEAWFAVEPAGAIYLRVNFQKQNIQKRAYDARLGRQGAFRKKKDDVAEINGHKFVSRQFYQIIRCALCGELLLNAAGSQCEDCRYTCHKKCAQKVVTKCISKSNAEADRDEVKINHRIPHRFEPITNIGANWCCHCGYILPFGRKNAKKCSECDITCHSDCAHLVPDFCGMSMEMANQLLSDIETINRVKNTAKQQQQQLQQQQAQTQTQQAKFAQPQPPPKTMTPSSSQQPSGSQDGPYGYGAARQGQQQQQPSGANGSTAATGVGRSYDSSSGRLDQMGQRLSHMDLASGPQDSSYGSSATAGRPPPSTLNQGGRIGSGAPGPPYYARPPQDDGAPAPQTGQTFNQQQQQPYSQQKQGDMSKPPRPLPQPASAGRPIPPVAQQQPSAPAQQQQGPLGAVQPARQPQQSLPPSTAPRPSQAVASRIVGAAPSQPPRNPPSSNRKIGLNDFNFLAVLGKGNFGKVMLAEEKRSGNLYAIKVLKKEFIIENDEVESTKSEKRVFLAAARERHPFLLGLHSCFQTETRVYFVMEYVSGGDLMLHIQKEQFSPKRAKFYAAEVLLALEYFHQQGIIYRDLKLDNIMLTLDGHVKVGDYGLCKEEMWYGNTTSTFCGTPEFMAPEILLEQRYGRAVDWWAFGILIYEMLLGQAPFRGDDEDEIFDAILEDEPLYPIHMPADSVSILHRLLTRDPAKRLGSGERDAEEIKAHPFFRDTNWDDMFHKRIPAPFKPTLKNPSDTSWFDSEFTSEKPTLTPVHSVLSAQDQEEFASFSWTSTTMI